MDGISKAIRPPVFKSKDKRSGQGGCGGADVVTSQIGGMSQGLEACASGGLGHHHSGSAGFSEGKRFPKPPSVPSAEFQPHGGNQRGWGIPRHLATIFPTGAMPPVPAVCLG